LSENPNPVAGEPNVIRAEDGPTQPAIFDGPDLNDSEKEAGLDGSLLEADKVEAPFDGPKLTESEEASGISGNLVEDEKVEADVEGEATEEEIKAGLTDEDAGEPDVEESKTEDYPANGTIDDVLAWVGDDSEKAKTALHEEESGEKRATLIKKLKAIG
jgi:hypothetical protein